MRTLKEEMIWLREWRDAHELSDALDTWFDEFNETWLHSALGYRTLNRVEESYNLTTRTLLENAR